MPRILTVMVCFICIIIICTAAVGPARGEVWIGPASSSGPLQVPASYQELIAGLSRKAFPFDDLAPGARVNQTDLGGVVLNSSPVFAQIMARAGRVAGALVTSEPIALWIEDTPSGPTDLLLTIDRPAPALGFALMGLAVPAHLKVFDEHGTLLGDYFIPAEARSMRRWVGVAPEGQAIFGLRLEPLAAGDYAIDDLELGAHTPEPTSILLWIALVLPALRGVHRARRTGQHIGRFGVEDIGDEDTAAAPSLVDERAGGHPLAAPSGRTRPY